MDEQIGENDIPVRVVALRQPVEHIHPHDGWSPAGVADTVERLRRDQVQPVQQGDVYVRPTRRPLHCS